MCQPYAKSATERNFKENANSTKPSTTLIVVIQEPDFGALLSQDGKSAKRVKGKAKARAKPNMPTVGANQSPDVTVCTRRRPIIGAVHENETSTRVNAIRKMEISPVVLDALVSTALAHLSGNLISNHPKKEKAKTQSKRKRIMLNTALVESSFNLLGPKIAVINKPRPKYMTTMDKPYVTASLIPFFLSFFARLRKKLIVIGMIGQMQGITNAKRPPTNPTIKI